MARQTKIRRAQRTLVDEWQGLSKKKPLSSFPKASIEAGADVETEHVGYRPLARRIAADHLTEDPNYYRKLKKAGLASAEGGYDIRYSSAHQNAHALRHLPGLSLKDAAKLAVGALKFSRFAILSRHGQPSDIVFAVERINPFRYLSATGSDAHTLARKHLGRL